MNNRTKLFTNEIRLAYEYAHKYCTYGPTLDNPPMSNKLADCAGLIFRAIWSLGGLIYPYNINSIHSMCPHIGMIRSNNISDVESKECVVCFQNNNLIGTEHISHVYYSLGGKSANDISKYDLGSNERIKEEQPFNHVPIDEWSDKTFLCCYYFPDDKKKDVPKIKPCEGCLGIATKTTGLYGGPSTAYYKLRTINKNDYLILLDVWVTNSGGNSFRCVQTMDGLQGYIFNDNIEPIVNEPTVKTVRGTDGVLNVRCGIGMDYEKVSEISEGEKVMCYCVNKGKDGTSWTNIKCGKRRGWVVSSYLK